MPNKELDSLAAQADMLDSGKSEANASGEPAPAQPREDQNNAAMFAAFSNVTMGFLKAIRARVAKGLPEINQEWTDASLQAVADTVPPVVNKYMAKIMPLVGDYPEEGALIMACLPLVMGYIAATGAASKVEKNDKIKPETSAAGAALGAGEGHESQG